VRARPVRGTGGPHHVTTRIDAYELREVIGAGATSTVFRATHSLTADEVAVKVLTGVSIDTVRDRANVLVALSHPNIAGVRAVVEDGDGLVFVRDLGEGPPLDAWLRQGPRMRPAQAVAFAKAIDDAVRTAARAGVSHGDIAPRNIILSPT